MNLDKRIAALEAKSAPLAEPVCVFLVAMEAQRDGRRVVGCEAGEMAWGRIGTEDVESLRARVAADLRSAGGMPPLVVMQYAEAP